MLYPKILAVAACVAPLFVVAQSSSYTPQKAQEDGLKAAQDIGASGAYSPNALMGNRQAQGGEVFGDRYNSSATTEAQSALKSTSKNENLKTFGQTAQDNSVIKTQGQQRPYSNDMDKQSDEATYFIVTGQNENGAPYSANYKPKNEGAFDAQSAKAKEIAGNTGGKQTIEARNIATGADSSFSKQCKTNSSSFGSNADKMTCTILYEEYETWCREKLEVKSTGAGNSTKEMGRQSLAIEGISYRKGQFKWNSNEDPAFWANLISLKFINTNLADYYQVKINGKTSIRNNEVGINMATSLTDGIGLFDVPAFYYQGKLATKVFRESNGEEHAFFGIKSPACTTDSCPNLDDRDLTEHFRSGENTVEFGCFSAGPQRKCQIELVATSKNSKFTAVMVPSATCAAIDALNKPIN